MVGLMLGADKVYALNIRRVGDPELTALCMFIVFIPHTVP